MTSMIKLPKDAVVLKDGHATTTSLKVAEIFGRRHDRVVRAIRELDCPNEFRLPNFGETSYLDVQGKPRPMYNLTKDGFTFLAMGFTGPKAAQFKIAYIQRFNEMETVLCHPAPAGEMLVSKDRYIELLEAENRLLKAPKPTRRKPVPLTNELIYKIYDLLAQGLVGSAIAAELGISSATVSFVRKLRPAIPLLTN